MSGSLAQHRRPRSRRWAAAACGALTAAVIAPVAVAGPAAADIKAEPTVTMSARSITASRPSPTPSPAGPRSASRAVRSGRAAAAPKTQAQAQTALAAAQAARPTAAVTAAVTASAGATRVAAASVLPSLGRYRWTTPVAGTHQTSTFRIRWGRLHAGLDFAGALGTPERSVCSGVVGYAGTAPGYGTKVEITCWDGTMVRYGHMEKITTAVGRQVRPGTEIAKLGNEGHSTGPHLHFEVHPNGGPAIDPAPWLAARGITPRNTPPAGQPAAEAAPKPSGKAATKPAAAKKPARRGH